MKHKLIFLTLALFYSTVSKHGAAQQRFFSPEGLAFDSSGHLWVANYGNSTIVEIDVTPGATGVMNLLQGNGLNGPTRLAFDSKDNLYVANSNTNQILEYKAPQTQPPTLIQHESIIKPLGIYIDTDHNDDLYVVNNGINTVTVRRGSQFTSYTLHGGINGGAPGAISGYQQQLFIGNGPNGQPSSIDVYNKPPANSTNIAFTGSIPNTTSSKYTGPTAIAVGTVGDIYVWYLYSGNAVWWGSSSVVMASPQTGYCEGLALHNGFVYVANSAPLNSISIFTVNITSGTGSYVGTFQ